MKARQSVRHRAAALALAFALGLTGCDQTVDISGRYRDADRPEVVYEFGPDGRWSATLEIKVPLGLLPHGSGQKLEGVYRLSGTTLDLTCEEVLERDPLSGEYRAVRIFDGDNEALRRGYDHAFAFEDGALRPLGEGPFFSEGKLTAVGD